VVGARRQLDPTLWTCFFYNDYEDYDDDDDDDYDDNNNNNKIIIIIYNNDGTVATVF
jgi:hypothetical protein